MVQMMLGNITMDLKVLIRAKTLMQKLSNGSILHDDRILKSFKLPRDRKIAEALLIKSRKPDINVQGASVPLNIIFNLLAILYTIFYNQLIPSFYPDDGRFII